MKYIKEFDALRAIAVILVLFWHYLPAGNIINKIPTGYIGVDIFFVLSGFLITSILLEHKGNPLLKTLKSFYLRRSLRIFPIYYLTIFILLFVNTGTGLKAHFVYFYTYTSNFYFYNRGDWDGIVGHFWSLAVEEQFYLIWPFVILLTPKKYLFAAIITTIVVGSISQYFSSNMPVSTVFPLNCIQAFGVGALVAVSYKEGYLKNVFLYLSIFLPFVLVDLVQGVKDFTMFNRLRLENSIIAGWVIAYILVHKPLTNYILNNKIFIFLGRLSYGIYIYHAFIPSLLKYVNSKIAPHSSIMFYQKYNNSLFWIEVLGVLILISWLSYNYIEKPILTLKGKINY